MPRNYYFSYSPQHEWEQLKIKCVLLCFCFDILVISVCRYGSNGPEVFFSVDIDNHITFSREICPICSTSAETAHHDRERNFTDAIITIVYEKERRSARTRTRNVRAPNERGGSKKGTFHSFPACVHHVHLLII